VLQEINPELNVDIVTFGSTQSKCKDANDLLLHDKRTLERLIEKYF